MAGASFSMQVRVEGIPDLARRFNALLHVAADRRPTMRRIGAAILFSTQRRFERQRGPDGDRWRPLSEATRLRRLGGKRRAYRKSGELRAAAARRLGLMQILRDTGRLYSSLTWRATNDEARVGTNVVYGGIHQFGGQAGRGRKTTIPARPFLGLSDDDVRTVGDILTEDLAAAFYGRRLG